VTVERTVFGEVKFLRLEEANWKWNEEERKVWGKAQKF
jgi:hypothetical protein